MTITQAEIKTLAAIPASRWVTDAKRIETDIPGVSILRLELRGTAGPAHIEVYSDRRETGAASLIVGNVGQPIAPNEQMCAAYRAHGCSNIHEHQN